MQLILRKKKKKFPQTWDMASGKTMSVRNLLKN